MLATGAYVWLQICVSGRFKPWAAIERLKPRGDDGLWLSSQQTAPHNVSRSHSRSIKLYGLFLFTASLGEFATPFFFFEIGTHLVVWCWLCHM